MGSQGTHKKVQMSTRDFLGQRQVHAALTLPANNKIQKKKTKTLRIIFQT